MRLKWLVVALLVLIGLVVFPQLAFAAEPGPGTSNSGASEEPRGLLRFVLDVWFDEKGEWTADASIESPGMNPIPGFPSFIAGNLSLQDQSYESLTALFGLLGMEMDLPKAAPDQVQQAAAAGLQSIAISKTFLDDDVQEVRLYANDRLLIAAEASSPLLGEAMASLGMGGLEQLLLPLVTQSETTVAIHFPTGEMAELTFADELEPAEGPHKNVISLGATVAESAGVVNIVSVGGFSVDEVQGIAGGMGMDLVLPFVRTTLFSDFNIEELTVSAGQEGLMVDAGDGRWIKMGWDADSRTAAIEMLPAVGEFLYWDFGAVTTYMAEAETWIAGTGLELKLYVSDTPHEGVPILSIGEPILVEVKDDGGLVVEGFDLGAMGVNIGAGALTPYAGALPLAVSWEGEGMRLRLSVAGAPMPYIAINPDTLPTVGGLFLSEAVPMKKLTAILQEADLQVALGFEGGVGEENGLDYEVAEGAPPRLSVVPRVVIDREGYVGIGDPPMRLSTMISGVGMDIGQVTDMVRLYAAAYGDDLDLVGITVDPASLSLAIDQETALKIMWDAKLRQNLLGVVGQYYPIPDIPFLNTMLPDWKERVIDAAVGTGWGAWGVEVAIADAIPASGLELMLKSIGLLR